MHIDLQQTGLTDPCCLTIQKCWLTVMCFLACAIAAGSSRI